ncbi:hypothetical protein, partial [Sediminimonas sp.]|uniref:hypothetical protein n=1 Tax=Sediminimonas sp. TaxID=2823379 RepID=UPI0025F228D3
MIHFRSAFAIPMMCKDTPPPGKGATAFLRRLKMIAFYEELKFPAPAAGLRNAIRERRRNADRNRPSRRFPQPGNNFAALYKYKRQPRYSGPVRGAAA